MLNDELFKGGYEGQMIAETIEIFWAQIVAAWLHATIFLVRHKQKGCVIDTAADELLCCDGIAKDVVETAPETVIAVGAFCAVTPLRIGRDLYKSVSDHPLHGKIGGIVIEVACDDDTCRRRAGSDGVNGLQQSGDNDLPIGAGSLFASSATGRMDSKDMECVACDHLPANIEDVACRTESFRRCDADGMMVDQRKGKRRIEKRHIDAALIRTVGDHILITCVTEQ